ncbi:MAG: 3-phosphoshikimate 1-carboxyvinyltransferase [Patescibacteria group bacterium]
MQVTVIPGKIEGVVVTPPSKSITHRAIVLATLAKGESVLTNILYADDTEATMDACRGFGASIKQEELKLVVQGTGGTLCIPSRPLECGLSGTTLRFALALAALAPGETIITGGVRLLERPLQPLYDALQTLGAEVTQEPKRITVRGGALQGGKVRLPGNVSSQFVSALLMIAPFLPQGMTIAVEEPIYSRPYIDLTIALLKELGVAVEQKGNQFTVEPGQSYRARRYAIEGDYSSAQYWFAAAAVTRGEVKVLGLAPESVQGDRKVLDILRSVGCEVKYERNAVVVRGAKSVKPFSVDGCDVPDLVPTLAVLAAVAPGMSVITHIGHLRGKESDRLAAPAEELAKMGIRAEVNGDSLKIHGGKLKGAVIDPHGDHRMAMAFAVAGLAADGETVIQDAEVVSKSYPGFWEALGMLIGKHA